jgi:hypothetical protein
MMVRWLGFVMVRVHCREGGGREASQLKIWDWWFGSSYGGGGGGCFAGCCC